MDYSQHYQHQQVPQLLPGWVETIDPSSGRTYYANATTGESSWDIPRHQQHPLLPPPPPPPPPPFPAQLSATATQRQNYPDPHHVQEYSNVHHQYNSTTYSSSTGQQTNWENYSSTNDPNEATLRYGNDANTNNNYYGHTGSYHHYQSEQQQPQQYWSTMQPAQQFRESITHDGVDNSVVGSSTTHVATCDTTITKEDKNNDPIDNELRLFSAGQIADQCYMQQQQQSRYEHNNKNKNISPPYSTPILMTQQSQRPGQEIGRLHTRYYTLREQLRHVHGQ